MKKSILYLFLLLAIPSMAQYRGHGGHVQGGGHGPSGLHETSSSLTVIAPKQQAFWLFVDDVLQNENAVHSIRINNIRSVEVYIRVELDNGSQDCVGRYVDMSRPQSFNIVQQGNLFGFKPVQINVRPEVVKDLLTATPRPPMPGQGMNGQPHMPGQGMNGQPPMPGQAHMEMGMNPKDFNETVAMLSQETFDDTRLATAKQIVAKNPMTVNQIAQICRLFTYESNRLELAKFAYPFCVDKNKYYMLNEVFTYDSSKRELNDYIMGL